MPKWLRPATAIYSIHRDIKQSGRLGDRHRVLTKLPVFRSRPGLISHYGQSTATGLQLFNIYTRSKFGSCNSPTSCRP
uniref:Uncharacterized protein n=1 Tax=Arundo donax TaxID=35708 RepID=A0A0A9GB52_ARUDO